MSAQCVVENQHFKSFYLNNRIKAGETFNIVAEFSEPAQVKLFVNVFGRSGLVMRKKINLTPNEHKQFLIPITATKDMTPSCRIVCYYVQGSGEIVYDQLVLKVDPSASHKVSVALIDFGTCFKISAPSLLEVLKKIPRLKYSK